MSNSSFSTELLNQLNPAQREAVMQIHGPLLVIAGAGSGKTRVITYRIAYLIAEGGIPAHQILGLTFTNKAAAEMRNRVFSLLGLPPETHLPMGTFHSRCASILRREALKIGLSEKFQILDEDDQVRIVKELLKRLEIDPKVVQPAQAVNVISWAKTNMLAPEEIQEAEGFQFGDQSLPYPEIYKAYQEFLVQNDAVDFDDLLWKVVILFDTDAQALAYWRRRYPFILVDEYQDTNAVQFRLLEQLAGEHRNLCVVGDEDQSIYSWRGADIHNLLDFQKHFAEARLIRLEQNYRSTKRILTCADSVIKNNKERLGKTLFTEGGEGPPILTLKAPGGYEEADWVVQRIREWHQAENTPYREMAVFYRINALSRVFEDTLRKERIPYRVVGGIRFYERAEVRDVISYLRLAVNPNSDVSFLRVVNVPRRGIGESTLDLLREFADRERLPLAQAARQMIDGEQLRPAPARGLEQFLALTQQWHQASETTPPDALLKQILKDTAYMDNQLGDTKQLDAITRRENVEELVNTLAEWKKDHPQGRIGDWLEQMALTSSSEMSEGQQEGISLMTLHAAKGLEFDTVFLVALESGLFPLQRAVDAASGSLEEERRLFYVGVTRARRRLVLSHATTRMMHGQEMYTTPSPFLREITPEVLEAVKLPRSSGSSSYGSSRFDPWSRRNRWRR
jgi:DNA helicase-2/ATP-dependent DNA helicase PcrA